MEKEYYKKLFKDNYRSIERAKEEKDNAFKLMLNMLTNTELMKPLCDWFVNLYFNGAYGPENSAKIALEESIKNISNEGYTKFIFFPKIWKDGAATSEILYIISNLEDDLIEQVSDIVESIKLSSVSMRFDQIDTKYFLDFIWPELWSSYFSNCVNSKSIETCEWTKAWQEKCDYYELKTEYCQADEELGIPEGMAIDFSNLICENDKLVFTMSN